MNINKSSTTDTQNGVIVEQLLNSSLRGIYSVETDVSEIIFGEATYSNPIIFTLNESKRIIDKKNEYCKVFNINSLIKKQLLESIDILVEIDEESYLARTLDLPLYATGDEPYDAIQNLKIEIETLYDELNEDDNFSDEWLNYKNTLNRIIK